MSVRSFGKYEVLARLATGGAANIFLARQPGAAGFHKLVCLKTLLPERASDADFVAMFLDEARLAARLNHPNCVQIYDLGRVKGVYYISMEYIFGDTLWNLLTTVTKLRTPLPSAHVATIIANTCDGLHHAHELKDSNGRQYNLVHRDVSPQNIMITFEGQTKVVDFGIAKAETGRAPTVAGIVKGKFSYMSPEQITGGDVDRRSDIYSLGIVLFECLASRRLYRGDSPEDIARLILEHRAPRLRDVVPDCPKALDELCAKALSRHPSKRFQTSVEMGDALREHLDDIRHNQNASSLAKLMEERFSSKIAERRQVFETALAGSQEEQRLLKAFDARKVRYVDLFPDDDTSEEDFVESTQNREAAKRLAEADAEETQDRRPEKIPSSKHGGPGWRIEISENQSLPSFSAVYEQTREDLNGAESSSIARTEIGPDPDPEGGSESATRVDPGSIEVVPRTESNTKEVLTIPPDANGDSGTEDIHDLAEVTRIEPSDPADAGENIFDEKTPFVAADPGIFDEQPSEDRESFPASGVVVTSGGMPPIPPAEDEDEIDQTINEYVESSVPVAEPTSQDAPALPRPGRSMVRPSENGVRVEGVTPAISGHGTPSVVISPARVDSSSQRQEMGSAVPDADPASFSQEPPSARSATAEVVELKRAEKNEPAGRYSLAAVLAALGFGLTAGLLAGLVLARVLFI